MAGIRGFTLDFSQLFNVIRQFNEFKKRVLFQPVATNSTRILPDLPDLPYLPFNIPHTQWASNLNHFTPPVEKQMRLSTFTILGRTHRRQPLNVPKRNPGTLSVALKNNRSGQRQSLQQRKCVPVAPLTLYLQTASETFIKRLKV